jgi:plasmid stability protein
LHQATKEQPQPALTLKNIPEELLQRLRDSAQRDRRSLTGEVLARLDVSLPSPPEDPDVTLARLAALRKKWKLKPLTEERMQEIQADKVWGRP